MRDFAPSMKGIMDKQNEELWTQIKTKYQRQLILALDAAVGGMMGGFATAVGSMGIRPDVFNLQTGLLDLIKLVLWSGMVSAGLYLRQKPDVKTPPPDSSGSI